MVGSDALAQKLQTSLERRGRRIHQKSDALPHPRSVILSLSKDRIMDDAGFAERAARRRTNAWTRLGHLGDDQLEELDPDQQRMTVEERFAAVEALSQFAWALKEGGDGAPRLRRSVTRLLRRRR
jgi:hypothetical protein